VTYIDGVKVMFNQRNEELIFVLPSAMYGKSLENWKMNNAEAVFNFVKEHKKEV